MRVKTMEPVKVCHMTSVHAAEDVRIFHKECVSLAEAGYDVYLVERGESYEKNGVHIIGVGDIPNGRLKRMTEGARRVYETALALDCKIYHFHDPELLPYGLKLKRKGKKVIFDSHELTREQIQNKAYLKCVSMAISYIYALYETYVLKRIDGVIFPCPIDGKFPLAGENTVFINNVPILSELYEKYNEQSEKEEGMVCTVGSLTYSRGIKHLILAAHRAGCKVVLAGIVRPKLFEQELKAMPESRDVSFLGQIDRDRVSTLYAQAEIGVSSILNVGQYDLAENLPTKVYEYMSMGLPVILTRNPFNEKMVAQYKFGICVDPENIEEFADAIRYLHNNPCIAKEMGKNGRKAVREVFNWDKEAEKLLALYDQIISSSNPFKNK